MTVWCGSGMYIWIWIMIILNFIWKKNLHDCVENRCSANALPLLCSLKCPQSVKKKCEKEHEKKVTCFCTWIIKGNIISNKFTTIIIRTKLNLQQQNLSKYKFFPINIHNWGKLEIVMKSFSTEVCPALVTCLMLASCQARICSD